MSNTTANVICCGCGQYYQNRPSQCPACDSESFINDGWWYGRNLPNEIHGLVLSDGRKVIPRFFVDVRAYLNPHDGPYSSWEKAEQWFRHMGWEWIENEEWYKLSFNRKKS